MSNSRIEIDHPNGYKGIIYGARCLKVIAPNGAVLSTGSRTVNTEEELYDLLEGMPDFMAMMREVRDGR